MMREKLQAFVKDFSSEWTSKTPPRQAAALAYYSMFSLAPVIFVALSISELLFQSVDYSSEIYNQVELTFGTEAANFLQSLVSGVASPDEIASGGTSPIVTLISLVALLYAATGLFYHLQYSLDLIWGVHWKAEGGFLIVVRSRLIAFFLVIGLGVILVLLEVLNVALVIVRSFPLFEGLVPAVDTIVLIGFQTLILMLFYKFLPRAKVAWRDVILASVITVFLIYVARNLVGIYLSFSNVSSAFQAAGSLAVILIAIYYVAQIFLFGAVFSRVYAHHFGSRKGEPIEDKPS